MIEVKGLCKRFGANLAVDELSFTVQRGEILGFLGPNGAGKTTTIRILTGFFPPNEGTALVGGRDVLEDIMAVRAMIGYLPESVPLYSEMRVGEYLHFVGRAKGLSSKQAKQEAGRVIEAVGLGPRTGQLIGQLSKGYRQRVGLAQALVSDPPVLILDEPTIGLDPGQIVEIRSLVRSFAGHKTVMLSSHILPEVEATCDRVVIINHGRLAAEVDLRTEAQSGAGLRLVARGPAEELGRLVAAVPGVGSVEPLQPPPGEADAVGFIIQAGEDQAVRGRLAKAVVEAGCELLELAPAATHLEDLFLRVIGSEAAADKEAA